MAVERKRGCGFRKVGGLYLVASGHGRPCCRLPIELHVCPTCSQGIKQARGWTWLDVGPFVAAQPCRLIGSVRTTPDTDEMMAAAHQLATCPMAKFEGRVGLLWVGEKFYRTPAEFNVEAGTLGISKRIAAIPRGFVLGETWVALAHGKVFQREDGWRAGIFRMFMPTAIELIVRQSEYENTEAMDQLRARGITPVPVPDDDRDHQGSVHDRKTAAVETVGGDDED